MSKINIVFVLPSLSAGGAQRVILNIIEKLDKNKFFVYLFVFNKGGPLVRHIPSNVKVISFNKNKLRSAYFPLILKLYKINPDIVLSTLPHVNFSIILFKLIFRSDCSVVVREANTASNTVRLSKYPRITKFLYKWLYGRSDKVIAFGE